MDKAKQNNNVSLNIIDIFNALGNNFSKIYTVDRQTKSITIYRYKNLNINDAEFPKDVLPFEEEVKKYIDKYVLEEDKEKMFNATSWENMCHQLEKVSHFSMHYRAKKKGRIVYYYMKCARIGSPDNFHHIALAFANEDSDIKHNKLINSSDHEIIKKRKLLIIDDDDLARNLLSSLLEDEYDLLSAENGEVGYDLLKNNYKDLSLVLLDILMPVCDGIEFLERIQNNPLLSSVPVIIITSNDNTETELKCLNLGAADFISKPFNVEIIKSRIKNTIKLKESTVTLANVERDALTGLYTEQAFLHYAELFIKNNPNAAMHLVAAKIKDFKLINSVHGTKKADELLVYLASVFNKNSKNNLVAKRGVSSYICLIYNDVKLDDDKIVNVINEISKNAPIKGVKIKYGIYTNIDKTLPISTACDYASLAKETVMNSYDRDFAYYTEDIANKRIYEQKIENSFESALENNEFTIYYQPKINISNEKVIGGEALVRWIKPDGTIVSPADFIPVYEHDGQIAKLDEYVFSKVCDLQERKKAEGKELIPISVNLSRYSALQDDIVENYIKIINKHDIPYSCVPIELTESAAIYGERIKETSDLLVENGFSLHIDDFGSGYSSLTSLNQFPFSTLKIDKSLIDHVCEQKGKTLVEQVIVLSKLLNMKVVAEGVETKEQLDEIKKMNCDEVQGFYFARPMPEEDFDAFLSNHFEPK